MPPANKMLLYNGNPNLRDSGVVLQYSQYQVDELQKCINDPIYFIEKYYKIVNVDKGLVDFLLYPYQKKAVKLVNKNRFVNMCKETFPEGWPNQVDRKWKELNK